MTAKLPLRVASILLVIHLIGHSIGHSGWKNDTEPAKIQVIHAMTGPKFLFMGVYRSMGNYFDGFGYMASVTLLLLILILWIASNNVTEPNRFLRHVVLTAGIALVAIGVLECIFFFPFAACISLLAGLQVVGARFRLARGL